MEAQQIKTLVERALISYSGTTTGDGGATGDTLVCSGLTTQPDYNRLSVLIAEGAYAGLTADINGITTGGTINVEPSFPGQIVSGINFHIIPRLPAYSELVDIMGTGFDTATDSLVKLKDDLVSLLATAAINQGLIYKGKIDSIPAANQFIVAGLAGLGAGKFAGATLPWQVYVLRDQAGGSAAPQGEIQPVTLYTTGTGQFNHSAFTVALTTDDEVLIVHPSVAHIDFSATEKTSINTEVDNALDTDIPGAPTAGSINERIKTINELLDSGESAGPFSYLDAGGEQDVVEDTATTRRKIWLDFSNRTMTQTGTFIIYRKVDGTNYAVYATQPVTVGAGDDRAFDAVFVTNQPWKLTYEEDVNEGAARAIPYNVITQVIE